MRYFIIDFTSANIFIKHDKKVKSKLVDDSRNLKNS